MPSARPTTSSATSAAIDATRRSAVLIGPRESRYRREARTSCSVVGGPCASRDISACGATLPGTRESLSPGHVVPPNAGRLGQRARRELVEIGDRRAPREDPKDEAEERTPPLVEQVRVVEVHVHERRKLARPQRPREVA